MEDLKRIKVFSKKKSSRKLRLRRSCRWLKTFKAGCSSSHGTSEQEKFKSSSKSFPHFLAVMQQWIITKSFFVLFFPPSHSFSRSHEQNQRAEAEENFGSDSSTTNGKSFWRLCKFYFKGIRPRVIYLFVAFICILFSCLKMRQRRKDNPRPTLLFCSSKHLYFDVFFFIFVTLSDPDRTTFFPFKDKTFLSPCKHESSAPAVSLCFFRGQPKKKAFCVEVPRWENFVTQTHQLLIIEACLNGLSEPYAQLANIEVKFVSQTCYRTISIKWLQTCLHCLTPSVCHITLPTNFESIAFPIHINHIANCKARYVKWFAWWMSRNILSSHISRCDYQLS